VRFLDRASRVTAPDRLELALRDALRVADGWLDYQRQFHRIPGLSAAIVHGNRIIFERGYGCAIEDRRRKRRVAATTRYRIASISKVFTATAVMRLVERGLVRLDERAQHYLPWLQPQGSAAPRPMTIRQLLSHTAGVERDGGDHWVSDRFPTIEDLKARARNGLTVFAPLERWKYSNIGYAILGQVVAAASGQPYEEYVRATIIDPLRLTHTGFALTRDVLGSLAVGYGREFPGRARPSFRHPDTNALRAAAGLVSNAGDLCAFMAAQFPGSGRLLSDLSKREMRQPQWSRNGDDQYGLGYNIWRVDGREIVGHGGGFQGFKTAIGMDTERRIGVAVLTNAIDGPAVPLMTGVFKAIHDCLARNGNPVRSSRGRARLRRFEGRYTGRWGDLELVTVGGQLLGYDPSADRPLQLASELDARGPGRFQIVRGPGGGHVGEMVTFDQTVRGIPARLCWGPNPMRRVNRSSTA